MYIHYDPVTAYRGHLTARLHPSRDTALKLDFEYALSIVFVAKEAELRDAIMRGEGTLFDAIKFLVDCGDDMRDIAERENTPAAKEESAS